MSRNRSGRSEDPLGFGLKSIPIPLQRLWLIRQGNPYFDKDAVVARTALELPVRGFTNAVRYVDWWARRSSRHGHDEQLPAFPIADGEELRDDESLIRYLNKDLEWPIEDPVPSMCCGSGITDHS